MISLALKDFLKNNGDLLDTDLRKFLGKALVRLRGTTFEELIHILEDAQIDVDKHRARMLINKLGFIFPVVDDNTPLVDVIKEHLMSRGATTFFGLSLQDLIDFVKRHEAEWADDMYLEEPFGILVVRTNND